MKRFPVAAGLLALAACDLAACDEHPSTPPLGSLEITTSAPTVEQSFTTTDGWVVKYTRFLVNVSAVNVAGADRVLTASNTAQVIDQAAPRPKTLLTAENRIARAWENVSFEIAPATKDSTPIAPVTQTDLDAMVQSGFSISIEGTMTRGTVVKNIRWGFANDTQYSACTALLGGVQVPGLVVPRGGIDSADVVMAGDVLFFDTVGDRSRALRGDPIVNADKDNDGTVTLSELQTTSLDDARQSTGAYGSGAQTGIDNLAGFLGEQVPGLVLSFRPTGTCTATSVTSANGQ